jgi:hypothetical protein
MKELNKKLLKLQKLFDEYCRIISSDHHKSSDGYFTIQYDYDGFSNDSKNTQWWSVEHDGYINYFKAAGNDLMSLLDSLEKNVLRWIKEEKNRPKD